MTATASRVEQVTQDHEMVHYIEVGNRKAAISAIYCDAARIAGCIAGDDVPVCVQECSRALLAEIEQWMKQEFSGP